MREVHCIAMDTHAQNTSVCVKTRANGPGKRREVRTRIPELRELIESVPRPRWLSFEEGPLADWLWRSLRDLVDRTVIGDPRRNALIAKDSDKDDPIDAEKLCDLTLGGYVREVHHPESLARVVLKHTVALYHEQVIRRVACANRLMGYCKCWGVIVREKDFGSVPQREALVERLVQNTGQEAVRSHVELLGSGYQQTCDQEEQLRREIKRAGKGQEIVQRWQEVPGIGPVRAATLLAYLDTPWRFKSKQALWKYLGIGLVREHSGAGAEYVRVEWRVNTRLKAAILGAAQSVIRMTDGNPFALQHEKWCAAGLSSANARRNVARSLAIVLWGMWKNGGKYDASLVGQTVKRLKRP